MLTSNMFRWRWGRPFSPHCYESHKPNFAPRLKHAAK